ncbi:Dot/Icm T4SS effector [Legionella nautarum]|uniref:Dot/Icm T4SS effector n=1 Tax=Legionella nautarum TaxID=45070 RepID=A0A0W0WWX7_9GAMM|nr:hypothetical protein [Legionella nautarum]KTD36825.1 Dot/Icm T4SS effector [Legionella nautarum]
MGLHRVVSVDFDGSVSEGSCDDILALPKNAPLIKQIKESNNLFTETHVFINSNRQSVRDDNGNSGLNRNGSCYPRIQGLSKEIGAIFHDVLLTDIYNDLEAGETFKQALTLLDLAQKDYVQDLVRAAKCPDWLHDSSKLSILLLQAHLFASLYPEDEFEFCFLDDKKEILDDLAAFFDIPENAQLLPYNLKNLFLIPHPSIRKISDNSSLILDDSLKNKKEKSALLTVIEKESPPSSEKQEEHTESYLSYAPIAGKGEIRFDYRDMIKKIAAVCIESAKFQTYDPCDESANPVRNYEQAKRGGFTLTAAMNFARDYALGKEPKDLPAPTEKLRRLAPAILQSKLEASEKLTTPAAPASPTAVSSKRGLLSSIFHPLRKEEKGKEKKKDRKEKNKLKDKKEIENLQHKLNKDLHEKFSNMEKEKEKKKESSSAPPATASTDVNQGPRSPEPARFFLESRARHPAAPPSSPSILSNHRGGIN